jgi:omega-amidase
MEIAETPADLRICLVQADLVWENPNLNWSKMSQLLAGQEGVHDLIILPEMFSTGFTMAARKNAELASDSETQAWMQYQASKLGAVVMGSIIVEDEGKYYNRLLVVGPDGLALKYDKRHLFRMSGEHETYVAGSELQVFTLKGWRICPMICYDLRFPVWSRNGMSPENRMWYDLLVYVANWPERRVAHWKALLTARAIENQAWVAGVNRVGTDGNDIVYSGDSMICDALGAVVAHSVQEELLTATLKWEELAAYREKFPAWADADKFELFG